MKFNSTIQVVNADDSVCFREMSFDGRMYDAWTVADGDAYDDDDAGSFDLGMENDADGQAFLDAVQDEISSDEDYFQSLRYVSERDRLIEKRTSTVFVA